MKKRFAVVFSITVLLLFCCVFAQAAESEKTSGLFTYSLKGNGTAVITGFNWASNGSEDVYIPRTIDGYTVTEIGESAFSSKDAKLSNPYGGTNQPDPVIVGNEVQIILPDTITSIGTKAFFCTSITGVNIPESVEFIGSGAFAGCINIQYFSVDPGNTTFATIDGLLYNKKAKSLIAVPMAKYGFDPRYLKVLDKEYPIISIPEGIKSIGDYAFYGMILPGVQDNLAGVAIPSSVESIGHAAFSCAYIGQRYNSLKKESEKFYYNYFGNAIFSSNNVKTIADRAFEYAVFDCPFFEFPSVEEIGNYAFYNCLLLGDWKETDCTMVLELPSSLVRIGEYAFSYFAHLNSRTIKKMDLSKTQLTEIPKGAFQEFVSGNQWRPATPVLQEVLLPDGLKAIGKNAFSGIGSRYPHWKGYDREETNVRFVIPASVTTIGEEAFSEAGLTLEFGENSELTTIGDKAFNESYFYNDDAVIELPSGLEEIGDKAFYSHELRVLVIPSSVSNIGETICDRSITSIKADAGSYAAFYASENGIPLLTETNEDTSWLND